MNMVNRTALANLKKNKSRNILTGVAICITTVLIITVFSVGYGFIDLQTKTINKYYPTFHGLYRDISRDLYDKVSKHADFDEVGIRADVGQVYQEQDHIILVYLDDASLKLEKVKLERGTYPKKEDEIVVSKGVLNALHVKGDVGDRVTIPYQLYSDEGLGKVVNKDFTITGILPTTKENETKKVYACLVSKIFMEHNIAPEEKVNQCIIRIKNSKSMTTDEIEEKLRNIAKNFSIKEQNVILNQEYLFANYVDPSIYTGIIVIVLIIIGAGVLTIYGIYYVSMIHKIQEFGKLKAIGATKRQIHQIVLREGFFIAGLSIPIGVIVGMLISRLVFEVIQNVVADNELNKMMVDMIKNREVSIYHWWIVLIGVVISLFTVLVSLLKPMKKAGKITPIEAMRYEGDWYQSKKTRNGKESVTVVGLTKSNLSRNKKRSFITILTLSATGILYVVVSTILSCTNPLVSAREEIASDFQISVDSWSDDQMHPERDWRVIQQNNPLNNSFYEEVKSISGVTTIEKKQYLSGQVLDYMEDNKPVEIGITGVDESFREEIEKGEKVGSVSYDELRKGDKIIVSSVFLHWYPDVKVGDQLHFVLYDGTNTRKQTFEVAAIGEYSNSLVPDYFILPTSVIDKICDNDMTYQYDISVNEKNKEEVKDQLTMLTEQKALLELKNFDDVLKIWKTTFSIMSEAVYAFLFLLAGIGLLNLINTMINSIYLRQKELGMLQAIGMSKNQLNLMLLLEGMFYTLGTLILSIGIGSILSYQVFLHAKRTHMFSIRTFQYPTPQVIILIGVITLVQITITFIVSHNIRKQTLVERIRLSE